MIELLNGGQDLKFTLENGPSVITRQMKQRQELTALATIMPDNMKPIIAKYFADTLKNDLGDELSRNIVANLPADVNFVTEGQDPAAVHMLEQMKMTMDMNMEEMGLLKQENEDLKKQLFQAQMSMMDGREQRELDWQKFVVSEQDKMMVESAKAENAAVKTENDAAKATNDAALKQQELAIKEAEVAIDSQEKETNQVLNSYKLAIDAANIGSNDFKEE
jgi:hypothetical protein